jgi:sphingosine kinase
VTTHANHAAEIIGEYNLEPIEGIVIVSGDGMLYEVLNGLLNRKDWNKVRNIPIGVIPGGRNFLGIFV